MALFKIEKGLKDNLVKNRPDTTEGYCYFTTDDGKFYIDIATGTGDTNRAANRILLNAGKADSLVTPNGVGGSQVPVYFNSQGKPVASSYNLSTMTNNISSVSSSLTSHIGVYDKHEHSVSLTTAGTVESESITPTGTITSTFTGTAKEHDHAFTGTKSSIAIKFTPTGTIGAPTFTGTSTETAATATASTVSVAAHQHTHTFTPSGTITAPKFTGTQKEISMSYTPAGSISKVPSTNHTHVAKGTVSYSTSVNKDTQCLSLSFAFAGSASNGPNETTAPTFIGTKATLSTNYTPEGVVGEPAFAGNTACVTDKSTASTTVPTSGHKHSVTATGTVSAPTFAGHEIKQDLTYTPSGTIGKTSITPVGSVSSAFAGNPISHNHTFTGADVSTTSGAPTT